MKAHAVVVAAATPMFCLAFLLAPAAWASPPTPQQVCDALDADPEPSTFISLLLEAAQDEGISTTAAGAQMGAYVGDRCPRHLPMLERYLADRQEASQR